MEQEKCHFPFAKRKEKRNGSVDDWVVVKSSKGLFFTLTIRRHPQERRSARGRKLCMTPVKNDKRAVNNKVKSSYVACLIVKNQSCENTCHVGRRVCTVKCQRVACSSEKYARVSTVRGCISVCSLCLSLCLPCTFLFSRPAPKNTWHRCFHTTRVSLSSAYLIF